MSRYLAYTRHSRPTGRFIAELLGFEHFGVAAATNPLNVLVRWGSRRRMPAARSVLNSAAAIARAADKVEAIRAMKAAGINTVPMFETWERAAARGGVVLGRTRKGMQGEGIVVYDPQRLLDGDYPEQPTEPHEWYSTYLEPTREVRIHVVGGEVVRVQGKYLDFPELAGDGIVRNHAAGYRYRAPRSQLRTRRKEMAIEAVRALGLYFGAVDMLLFGSEKKAMVLEINTAPACSPMTAEAYARALSRKISP